MNTKSKILVILGILIVATFTTGITYSLFFSETTLTYTNNLAKFVFNSNVIDSEYALPINELAPRP